MSYPMHPDDEEFRSGTWADEFATYSDACRAYGVDTPEQVAAEAAWYNQREYIALQDDIECRGGPAFDYFRDVRQNLDDMPF